MSARRRRRPGRPARRPMPADGGPTGWRSHLELAVALHVDRRTSRSRACGLRSTCASNNRCRPPSCGSGCAVSFQSTTSCLRSAGRAAAAPQASQPARRRCRPAGSANAPPTAGSSPCRTDRCCIRSCLARRPALRRASATDRLSAMTPRLSIGCTAQPLQLPRRRRLGLQRERHSAERVAARGCSRPTRRSNGSSWLS